MFRGANGEGLFAHRPFIVGTASSQGTVGPVIERMGDMGKVFVVDDMSRYLAPPFDYEEVYQSKWYGDDINIKPERGVDYE